MELFEPAAIVLLVLFGLTQVWAALSAARLPLRLLGLPKKRIAELREGPALLEGQIVATSASLTALDGTAAIATETRLLGADTWSAVRSGETWADAAISDGTGQCPIDLDGVLLLGEVQRRTLEAERVRTLCPDLWASCSDREKGRAMMQLEQRFVRAGGGFAAGDVAPGRRAAGEGYRDAPRERLAIQSGLGLPLVVATQNRSAVARHLYGPALLHAVTALFAFGLACLVFAVDRWIALAAGVSAVWP